MDFEWHHLQCKIVIILNSNQKWEIPVRLLSIPSAVTMDLHCMWLPLSLMHIYTSVLQPYRREVYFIASSLLFVVNVVFSTYGIILQIIIFINSTLVLFFSLLFSPCFVYACVFYSSCALKGCWQIQLPVYVIWMNCERTSMKNFFFLNMSMCQKVLLRRWTLEWKIKAEKSFSK